MKSGIYIIKNKINNKIYVGYATNITSRISSHKKELRNNRHKNPHLQNAYNEYGEENFDFNTIENCSGQLLCAREHYWAVLLNTHDRNYGYNEKPTDPNGVSTKHSEETRKKLSIANTGKKLSKEARQKIGNANRGNSHSLETREKISLGLKGKKRSQETKDKISKAHKGKIVSQETKEKLSLINKGKIISEETKQKLKNAKINFIVTWGSKISKTHLAMKDKKRRRVVQSSLDGKIIETWDSLLKVERVLGINNANIHKCCKANEVRKDKFLTLKGFIWRFESILTN